MTPDEVCAAYRAELARVYGEERAQKSRIDYGHGWYYINVAKHFDDGSVGTVTMPTAYRRKHVMEMIENLQRREPQQAALWEEAT